ncbi:thrombospondin type 3 repeat-containing protein [Chryseobacterium lactis]|uniref:thrombospondin type 3 repeat-containing protein n=2 Tax=Pseudomonadati TaxID=3379134 RepID=UPI0016277EEB
MKKYSLLLLFLFSFLQSQEITDQQELKKCRKEYSKKICLTDEDKDGILFYLDKCPKESGDLENEGCPWPDTDNDGIIDKNDACPDVKGDAENNGCPWPDTDGDGILDKDDACPTIPGVASSNTRDNGCPENNCEKYLKKQNEIFKEFKAKNNAKKERFTTLRNIIFNHIPKKFLPGNNIIVSIHVNTFINDNIKDCASRSSLLHDKQLFLDQLFWNEETFKYLGKKLKKNIFPTIGFGKYPIVRVLLDDYESDGYYSFMENFSKAPGIRQSSSDQEIYYYPGSTQKPEFKQFESLRIRLLFSEYESKNQATVEFVKGNDFQSFTYEYNNGHWSIVSQETHNHYNR